MRAASRVVVLTVVAATGAFLAPSPAAADREPTTLTCPDVIGDQPLSVTEPFSATVRTTRDDDGIASASLLCAYGEGVRPAAEISLAWAADGDCAVVDTATAARVRAVPFEEAGAELAGSLGGTCPVEEDDGGVSAWRVVGVVLVGLALVNVLRPGRRRVGRADRPFSAPLPSG